MKSTTLAGLTLSILIVFGAIHSGDADDVECNNNDELPSVCPDGAKIVPMTQDWKTTMLDYHMNARNELAHGKVKTSYRRMPTVEWDDELAFIAKNHVERCDFNRDACYNTTKYNSSGQNIAMTEWRHGNFNATSFVLSHIHSWGSSNNNTNMSNLVSDPLTRSKVTGNVSPIIAGNYYVGCSAVTYVKDDDENVFYLACNYAN